MLKYVCLVSVGLMTTVAASEASDDSVEKNRTQGDWLEIEHAEFILPPRGSDMIAGYVAIWNGTKIGAYLDSVESPDFSSVELNETKFENGVEKMVLKDGAAVPAHSELIMQSGGINLMAYGPTQQLVAGNEVELVFSFANAGPLTIKATILPSGTPPLRHYHGEIHGSDNGLRVNQ